MVEIDFNAQSDNGALAESKPCSNECCYRASSLHRSGRFGSSTVVADVSICDGTMQEPKSPAPTGRLAQECWIHGRRRANDPTADVCMVGR